MKMRIAGNSVISLNKASWVAASTWRKRERSGFGVRPDASKRHQGPGGPYTRHSKECRDDMPRGTTECPKCSRPGDLLKQKGGNSTLGFPPGGAGGWCGVGPHGHGDRGSVEPGIGERLETVEKKPGPRRGERGKTAENRRARRERRYGRRRERREGRGRVSGIMGGGSVVGGGLWWRWCLWQWSLGICRGYRWGNRTGVGWGGWLSGWSRGGGR